MCLILSMIRASKPSRSREFHGFLLSWPSWVLSDLEQMEGAVFPGQALARMGEPPWASGAVTCRMESYWPPDFVMCFKWLCKRMKVGPSRASEIPKMGRSERSHDGCLCILIHRRLRQLEIQLEASLGYRANSSQSELYDRTLSRAGDVAGYNFIRKVLG